MGSDDIKRPYRDFNKAIERIADKIVDMVSKAKRNCDAKGAKGAPKATRTLSSTIDAGGVAGANSDQQQEMMNVKTAYKFWSLQYDSNVNKTRDLEVVSLRETLRDIFFENCLEIGCGTGKNTEWLINQGKKIVALDLSDEMLAIAMQKVTDKKVSFVKADVLESWDSFTSESFDLVVCSLVLEHIESIRDVFKNISGHLRTNGMLYIGELHPFKQYLGSQAKFTTESGEVRNVSAFTHHIADYLEAATLYGLKVEIIKEYFDDNNRTKPPRILTLLLRKANA